MESGNQEVNDRELRTIQKRPRGLIWIQTQNQIKTGLSDIAKLHSKQIRQIYHSINVISSSFTLTYVQQMKEN